MAGDFSTGDVVFLTGLSKAELNGLRAVVLPQTADVAAGRRVVRVCNNGRTCAVKVENLSRIDSDSQSETSTDDSMPGLLEPDALVPGLQLNDASGVQGQVGSAACPYASPQEDFDEGAKENVNFSKADSNVEKSIPSRVSVGSTRNTHGNGCGVDASVSPAYKDEISSALETVFSRPCRNLEHSDDSDSQAEPLNSDPGNDLDFETASCDGSDSDSSHDSMPGLVDAVGPDGHSSFAQASHQPSALAQLPLMNEVRASDNMIAALKSELAALQAFDAARKVETNAKSNLKIAEKSLSSTQKEFAKNLQRGWASTSQANASESADKGSRKESLSQREASAAEAQKLVKDAEAARRRAEEMLANCSTEAFAAVGQNYRLQGAHLHPDKAGESSRSEFEVLKRGTDVLRDTERRQAYLKDMLSVQNAAPSLVGTSHDAWMQSKAKTKSRVQEIDERTKKGAIRKKHTKERSGHHASKKSQAPFLTEGGAGAQPGRAQIERWTGKLSARLTLPLRGHLEEVACSIEYEVFSEGRWVEPVTVDVDSSDRGMFGHVLIDVELCGFGDHMIRWRIETHMHTKSPWSHPLDLNRRSPEELMSEAAIRKSEKMLAQQFTSLSSAMQQAKRARGKENFGLKVEGCAAGLQSALVRTLAAEASLSDALGPGEKNEVLSRGQKLCASARFLLADLEPILEKSAKKDKTSHFLSYVACQLRSGVFEEWILDPSVDDISLAEEGGSANRLYQLLVEGRGLFPGHLGPVSRVSSAMLKAAASREDIFSDKQCQRLQKLSQSVDPEDTISSQATSCRNTANAKFRVNASCEVMRECNQENLNVRAKAESEDSREKEGDEDIVHRSLNPPDHDHCINDRLADQLLAESTSNSPQPDCPVRVSDFDVSTHPSQQHGHWREGRWSRKDTSRAHQDTFASNQSASGKGDGRPQNQTVNEQPDEQIILESHHQNQANRSSRQQGMSHQQHAQQPRHHSEKTCSDLVDPEAASQHTLFPGVDCDEALWDWSGRAWWRLMAEPACQLAAAIAKHMPSTKGRIHCQVCNVEMGSSITTHLLSTEHFQALQATLMWKVPSHEDASSWNSPWVATFDCEQPSGAFYLFNHVTGARAIRHSKQQLPADPSGNYAKAMENWNGDMGWWCFMKPHAQQFETALLEHLGQDMCWEVQCDVCSAPMTTGVASHIQSRRHFNELLRRLKWKIPQLEVAENWDKPWISKFSCKCPEGGVYRFNHITGSQGLWPGPSPELRTEPEPKTPQPEPCVIHPASGWQKFTCKDRGDWWWRESDGAFFLESSPSPWAQFADPVSLRRYWWNEQTEEMFWVSEASDQTELATT